MEKAFGLKFALNMVSKTKSAYFPRNLKWEEDLLGGSYSINANSLSDISTTLGSTNMPKLKNYLRKHSSTSDILKSTTNKSPKEKLGCNSSSLNPEMLELKNGCLSVKIPLHSILSSPAVGNFFRQQEKESLRRTRSKSVTPIIRRHPNQRDRKPKPKVTWNLIPMVNGIGNPAETKKSQPNSQDIYTILAHEILQGLYSSQKSSAKNFLGKGQHDQNHWVGNRLDENNISLLVSSSRPSSAYTKLLNASNQPDHQSTSFSMFREPVVFKELFRTENVTENYEKLAEPKNLTHNKKSGGKVKSQSTFHRKASDAVPSIGDFQKDIYFHAKLRAVHLPPKSELIRSINQTFQFSEYFIMDLMSHVYEKCDKILN